MNAVRTSSSRPSSSASCALVGAGPGDPELLTLKALKVIQAATVLFVDDLVGEGVVALASPHARVVHVGKRGGCRSTPQAFIERLMIDAARRGERVVRLKGGDPFIFGRGGEEADALCAAGIDVEVVNGITAGLAAATALGAPLTHRSHAHGVLFVTGHPREGGAPFHWPALGAVAVQGITLVIYMGVAKAACIEAGLLETMTRDTPVAIVQHASLPHERVRVTRLEGLANTLAREGLGSPAIIVVGDVLLARAALDARGVLAA